jgi:hypothetical protein
VVIIETTPARHAITPTTEALCATAERAKPKNEIWKRNSHLPKVKKNDI